jgi:thioredoxin-like negative regulator of GroEL
VEERDRELEELLNSIARKMVSGSSQRGEAEEGSRVEEPVKYIADYASFREAVCKHPVVVAIFTSPTCPACRMYKPIFYRYASMASRKLRGRVGFMEVDVYYAYEAAMEVGVMATPTTVIFHNCRPVDGFAGVVDEETLHEILAPYLEEASEEAQ